MSTQRNPAAAHVVARGMAGIPSPDVPPQRRPLTVGDEALGLWYEDVLGWPTVPGRPVRLVVGVRFDVLDVPAEAGGAALARLGRHGRGFPVALSGDRMRLLVAAGSAEELPGLLEWLDWGAPPDLDLTAIGAGGLMEAPGIPGTPPGVPGAPGPVRCGAGAVRDARAGAGDGSQGAAVWLRPPGPEREAGASLPTISAMGTSGAGGNGAGPPDLVRLVNTVATQVHRVRLRRAGAAAAAQADGQPLAFS
ncbi:SCO3374 family protein [Streptomyces pilosus]